MKRQNIIVLIYMDNGLTIRMTDCYGNLKKACVAHGWSYSTVSKKKLPITKDGWLIQRVPFN